ncbi:hypothetical protein [Ancylobacter oerskovii]|uniref:Uncharacterized protein n=1 Tax=Ancylobacter oerskovii TaxID=459519 RepID=A0ABW4Z2C9_9HYPH|nr:hypothetical protein [Ancylobacter oerskovii]MBS7545039.1 hypothetical protein [Ancylobacter oerskovii]
MRVAASEVVRWLRDNGLNPADFRLRLEAKTITAQRDLINLARTDVDPHLIGKVSPTSRPALEGIELILDGPMPRF